MIELFTDSGIWVYIILFFGTIIFSFSLILLIKKKIFKYKTILSYLFFIPFAIGISGTLIGYHYLIDGIKTMHLSIEIVIKAEIQVWYPFYLGLIYSFLLYIFGIIVWIRKRNNES